MNRILPASFSATAAVAKAAKYLQPPVQSLKSSYHASAARSFSKGPTLPLDPPLLLSRRVNLRPDKSLAGQILTCHSIGDVAEMAIALQNSSERALVACDLDDTLITPEPPWIRAEYRQLRNKVFADLRQHDATLIDFVYSHVHVVPREKRTVETLAYLRTAQIDTIGFTARRTGQRTTDGIPTQQKVANELAGLDIRFGVHAPIDSFELNNLPAAQRLDSSLGDLIVPGRPLFQNNILFSNNFAKGDILGQFLERFPTPTWFVMVDDVHKNLENIQHAVALWNQKSSAKINFLGFHYVHPACEVSLIDLHVLKRHIEHIKQRRWVDWKSL